jgi:hypothetical protein
MKEQLSANDRRLWFEKDLDDKLQEEPNHLCNWLMMTERLLRIAKRENKKRPRSSMIMHRFLGLPQEKIKQQQEIRSVSTQGLTLRT